jgi:hypothetical protein
MIRFFLHCQKLGTEGEHQKLKVFLHCNLHKHRNLTLEGGERVGWTGFFTCSKTAPEILPVT